jgi:primosomal protein N' (replication factor Y)
MPSANASFAGPEDPPIPAGCGAEDSPPGGAAQDRAAVLLPLPLAGAYDYRLPAGMSAPPGSFVAVPLGPRLVPGVVWGPGSAELPEARLKPIDDLLDAPPLKEELRRFVDWVANYTLAPRGAVLRMAMSVTDALQPPRPTAAVTISEKGRAALGAEPLPPLAGEGRDAGMPQDERPSPASPHPALPRRRGRGELSPTRRRVLALAAEGAPRPAAELARAAGCGAGVVRALVDLGLLETVLVPARRPREQPDWRRPGHAFSPEQAEAAAALAAKARTGGFSVTLLDGVTGSGKTEVYFEAVAAALQAGKQVLVLLPEIALGAQFLGRFARRFGAPPAEWHSDLSASERRQTWRDVAEGGARVVVGARSALFLPFPDLGLVVVDEEHEGSYKQEDVVAYHARDMAVVRGSIEKIPVVLVSATPSL